MYLLMALWLDIAFNVSHIQYAREMNMKHF